MAISSSTSAASAPTTSFNVDGVVSGLNTSALITQLMTLSQAPLNQLNQQQAQVKARDTAYKAISSQLITFQGSVQNLLLSTSINAKIAVSTVPTVATATADATAINGNFSINVAKLATATAASSGGVLGSAANLAPATLLSAAGMSVPPSSGKFTLNGQTINVSSAETWSQLQSDISTATGGAVTFSMGANGVSLTSSSPIQLGAPTDSSNFLGAAGLLNAAQTGSAGAGYTVASNQLLGEVQPANALGSAGLSVPGGISAGGSFAINGVSIGWANTDSINNILARINSSAAGVTATYDPKQDKVNLTNSNTGAQSISLVDGPGSNLLLALRLTGATSNGSLGSPPDFTPSTQLSSANLTTAPTAGNFTINGQTVAVTGSDTWSSLQSKLSALTGPAVTLNLGSAGVSLSSSAPLQLGAAGDTSNLLQALQLVSPAQVSGAAAQYTTTQNGVTSATQYSNSNIVTGAVQGVKVTLLGTGITNLSTTQDTDTATKNVQTFITQFNTMVDLLDTDTTIDATGATAGGILAGDSTITGLANQLRSIVTQAGIVPAGSAYNTMGDIGISTGAYGSAVGTTNHLILDTGKLTTALTNNPQAVAQLLSGLSGTTSIGSTPSSNTWIQSASGSPYGQVYPGSYKVTFNPIGNTLTSVFTSTGGTISPATTSTILPGGTNTSLIPGVTLMAQGLMSAGTDTINYAVSGRGILQTLNDYVQQSRGPTGIFTSESATATATEANLTTQIANQNVILAQRKTSLQAQFTAMEVALATLQSQGAALSSSLGVATTTAAANSASSSSSSASA